jgi:antitoxin CptB
MAEGLSKKQIAWRCRRGTKELDVILGGFVQNCFDDLSEIEKAAFESLLEEEDTVLTEWLCYGVIPCSRINNQGMVNIVTRILSTHKNQACE